MTPDQTVAAEARARRWAVPAAAIGAALPLIGFVARSVTLGKGNSKNTIAQLADFNDKSGPINATAFVSGIGFLVAAAALFALVRAVRARRPGFPAPLGLILVVGAVLSGLNTVASSVTSGIVIGDFFTRGDVTYQRASDLNALPGPVVIGYVGLVAGFLFGAGLVAVSLNAMRVGLLPRFLGYVGIFAGIFTALPIVPAPILFSFWLGAVGYLFSGRWPSGLPPAWRTGRAEPWPSLQQVRERAAAGADTVPAPEPVPVAGPPAPADPGAARRKRKKRR